MRVAMPETEEEHKNLRIKVISMGAAECGKSCLIKRYCEKRFVSKYMATLGIDFGVTTVKINDYNVKVNIFDMAGQPFFYEVRNEFYKDTQGVLLVYDVTNRASFDVLGEWVLEMRSHLSKPSDMDSVAVVVCANKTDLGKRKVTESEGRLWAETKGYLYFETSAQSGEGVVEMFQASKMFVQQKFKKSSQQLGAYPILHNPDLPVVLCQTLFSSVVGMLTRGERPGVSAADLGYTPEQASLVQRIQACQDSYSTLGLPRGCSRDDINKAYKQLAVLLHPDKNLAPGSDEAFKAIAKSREELLRNR